jgi:hypothetical protein
LGKEREKGKRGKRRGKERKSKIKGGVYNLLPVALEPGPQFSLGLGKNLGTYLIGIPLGKGKRKRESKIKGGAYNLLFLPVALEPGPQFSLGLGKNLGTSLVGISPAFVTVKSATTLGKSHK